MSSERLVAGLKDIIHAIDLINAWLAGAGGVEQALLPDTPLRSAVERQLLIVSEAAIRLHKIDAGAPQLLSANVDWPGVRGIGNFIRHKYDDLDAEIIADVLGGKLAALRAACVAAVEGLQADG